MTEEVTKDKDNKDGEKEESFSEHSSDEDWDSEELDALSSDEEDGKQELQGIRTGLRKTTPGSKDQQKPKTEDNKSAPWAGVLKKGGAGSNPNAGAGAADSNEKPAETPAWKVNLKKSTANPESKPAPTGSTTNSTPPWGAQLKKANPGPAAEGDVTTPPTQSDSPAGASAEIPAWKKHLLAVRKGEEQARPATKFVSVQSQQQPQQQRVQTGPTQSFQPGAPNAGFQKFVNGEQANNPQQPLSPKQPQSPNSQINPTNTTSVTTPANTAADLGYSILPANKPPEIEPFTRQDAKNAYKVKKELELLKAKLEFERNLRKKAEKRIRTSQDDLKIALEHLGNALERLERLEMQMLESQSGASIARIQEMENALIAEFGEEDLTSDSDLEVPGKQRDLSDKSRRRKIKPRNSERNRQRRMEERKRRKDSSSSSKSKKSKSKD